MSASHRPVGLNPAAPPSDSIRDPLDALGPLLGRHIAFHRRLVDVTGCVKAALLLSQAIYWTRHGRDVARSGGWFSKTAQQWEMETGLTEREQGRVRAILRARELIAEQRKGLPARLHFRLCPDRLAQALLAKHAAESSCGFPSDGHMLGQLLGPTLAYHRALAAVTDGVHTGLMLSRALHLSRQDRQGAQSGWVTRTTCQWTEDLGLTRREQETARRLLVGLGLWEERLVGIPRRIASRVRIDVLIGLLSIAESKYAIRTRHSEDLAQTPPQNAGSVVSDRWTPVSTRTPPQCPPNRHDSDDRSATPQILRTTGVLVQPPHSCAVDRLPRTDLGGGGLIFPLGFAPEERDAARVLLAPVAPQAQLLLDELSGRIQANAVRDSPIAYLRGLVIRATAGTFVPEAGVPIAVARRKREAEEAQRHQSRRADRDGTDERESAAFQRRVAERRAEMQQWLATHRGGQANGRKS